MAKTKAQKQEAIALLLERLRTAKATVFTTFTRMSIKDQEALRRSLCEAGVSFTVFKKTILEKALKEGGFEEGGIETWEGNLGVATAGDEVAPARTLMKALKAYEGLRIHLGILEGRRISEAEIKELSLLPSREELLAWLISAIAAPIRSLSGVLLANQRNVVGVLSQIKNHE